MPHVLVVDDDENSRTTLAQVVAARGFTVATASSLQEARGQMAMQQPDAVLLDLVLPDGNGMELFQNIENPAITEMVLITGHASLESSIEALRLGAADYLVKPVNIGQLERVLSRVARPTDLKEEIANLRGELRDLGRVGRLIGQSPAMQSVFDQIVRVAPTAATVFITGESGTGKEVVAQTIHELSRRRKHLFLPINCGAISPQLIESEIFGHEKGSFTGANRQHRGYFERGNGGTVFLDEITEMPADLQVKLLRVLETGTFMRIGSTELIESDVRMIAATNRNPLEAVEQGKLREDLLYRLQVFPLHLPPLRERLDDLELLAKPFLEEINRAESTHKRFAPEVFEKLRGYHWPGNIRELRNAIQRAFIMAEDDVIGVDAFPQQLGGARPRNNEPYLSVPVGSRIEDVERSLILATLQQCARSKEEAAEMLGISLKTLYNRLREYNSNNSSSSRT